MFCNYVLYYILIYINNILNVNEYKSCLALVASILLNAEPTCNPARVFLNFPHIRQTPPEACSDLLTLRAFTHFCVHSTS